MTLAELQEKRGRLVWEAREALDAITANTDSSRAAELERRHDEILSQVDSLDRNREREERLARAESRVEADRARRRPIGADTEARGQDEGDKLSYRQVFYKFLSRGADPGELDHVERAVLRGGVVHDAEKRVQVSTQGTSTTAGGYTVPVELSDQIVRSMKMFGPMYDESITTAIDTATGVTIKLPTVDDTAKTVVQHSEGAALTDDNSKDVVFGQKSLEAYSYDTTWIKFSMELARDSIFNVESLLGSLLGERLGRRANLELTTGDGTGDPNGIVTAASSGKTAAGTTSVTYDEIVDLIHSVDPAYRASPKTRFMFADSVLAIIRKLKDGDGKYIWTAGDVQGGVPGTLLGFKYSVNQAMPAMTTGLKPIIFGDLGKYYVRRVGQPTIGVVRERFWPDLGIAGVISIDGELADQAAVKYLAMA